MAAAAFHAAAHIQVRESMAMSNVLPLLLLLLPALAACQTSRVQGFSVFRDQRESYILEAGVQIALPLRLAALLYLPIMIITCFTAFLFLAWWRFTHASERYQVS